MSTAASDQMTGYAKSPPGRVQVWKPAGPPPTRWRFGRRISKRDVANVTSQLAIMARSGINVASALRSLSRQSRHPRLREILHYIHEEVMAGRKFSEALGDFSDVFGDTYVASLAAGEASGRMSDVLAQLARLLRRELRLRSTIRTLLAYPVMLTAVSSVVMLGLVLFVLPQFADIFARYEMPLPMLTQMLLGMASEVRARLWLWLPIGAAPFAALAVMRWTESGGRLWDWLILNTLLIREVSRVVMMGRLCRLLGLMLDNGVPLVESLQLARSSTRNSYFRDMFADLEDSVINGRSMGECLAKYEFLPSSAADMLMTAEQTGNLGGVAELIGEHYEEEGETKLREIVTVLEPTITVGMGVVVAIVVLAVMLPMFDLTNFAQSS